MTNKSPRLPRKAFALPAPPAPPNSPALLPPAPAKQDSFALRVVEGIEDAALVEIKCDAPATKTAIELMVVLDISGSMSTECKVQDASGQAQKHGFSILDVCKHATRALAATLDADSRLGLITFDNIAELVLPSANVDEGHVALRRPKLQSRRARLLTANQHLISFLKKIVQPVSAPLRLDGARLTGPTQVKRLHTVLDDLAPRGCTNLWGGLEKALDELRKDGSLPRAVVLLTDGLPNTRPEGGEVEALRKMKRLEKNVGDITVHTFGFGYSLDDEVLDGLASEAGGIFAFVPDAGMVGTTFTNLSASLRATAAAGARLNDLPLGDLRRGETKHALVANPEKLVLTGRQGQDLARATGVMHMASVADRRFAAAERFRMQLIDALRISPLPAETVSFQPGDRIEAQFQGRQTWYAGTISRATATGYDVDYDDGDKEQNVSVTLIRSQVTDAWASTRRVCAELAVEARDMLAGQLFGLGDALAAADASAAVAATKASGAGASEALREMARADAWRDGWEAALRRAPPRSERRIALALSLPKGAPTSEVYELAGLVGTDVAANRIAGGVMDLEGQVKIATSSQREWKRWGRYYCRSLASAHRSGTCHNFKDQSVQHYFGSVAKDLLADADAAFSKLPPPKPSRKGCGVASGAAMARAYHYRGNGCVAGDSLARLFDGTSKPVADVVKGDVLVDALTNGPAVVRCVVRTRMLDPVLYAVGDVRATAWHPCKTPGGDRWSFPAEVTTGVDCDVAYVYSFLFEGGATGYLSVGGTAVIGLGHGIGNDSVASHPFFGTARVIDALKDCPGFSEGRVDLLDGAYVRAAGNRYVSAIDPDRVVGPMASRTVPTMAVEAPLVAASA